MSGVTINVDLSGVIKRTEQMTKLGQYALVNQVHADSNNYVPALDYDLRNQSTISTDGKKIIWNVPYARIQYHTQFSRYTTPGTGPYWDKKAQAIHGDSWIRIAEKSMK